MSAIGWPAVSLSVSGSFLGTAVKTAVEVKLPIMCAGGQPAQPGYIRSVKCTPRKVSYGKQLQ